MRKYWTKAKLKTSWANSKLYISVPDVKMLFRSPRPFSFADCSTLLSCGLVPLPVSSSPWQVSHNSGISNILGFPRQSRLQLHSSGNGLSDSPPFRDTHDTCLASAPFCKHRGKFHNPFMLFLTLKPEPHG